MQETNFNPKSDEVKIYTKQNNLLTQVNPASINPATTTATVAGKLSIKAIIIITSVTVAVAATATVVGVYASKSNEEEEKSNEIINQTETISINYTKEEFYSDKTKAYYDLINNLEQEKAILYHWNLELDQNNNAIFKNKYQSLYNYSTDLKPVDPSVGYHLYKQENYRMIDTDLSKYYKAINGTNPAHLIYGPSINGKEYARKQLLYSDTIKLGKENKNGISISFNI